jgi:hypothetical protein
MNFGCGFPWAMPIAKLTMAVGQLWDRVHRPHGCALGY